MLQEKGNAKDGLPPGVVRSLTTGNYFGEIAPMFKCNRSATVMSRNFGTYGQLKDESMYKLLDSYPTIRIYLWENLQHLYDDDLKLFLFE